MDEKKLARFKEAGKVSSEALKYARTVVKEGVSVLEAADKIESFIRERNCLFAFPVNVSINEAAAHYAPSIDDKLAFKADDVVKIDLGARIEDHLTDCAITIDLSGKNSKLVEASEKALEAAISMVKHGRKVNEIGREIEKIAKQSGFKPIKNLGGHGITSEELHANIFIPNYDNGDETELKEGDVIAIEPFITDGEGLVKDGEVLEIFQLSGEGSYRTNETRAVADYISQNFLTYPFAMRWLLRGLKEISEFRIRRGISEMLAADALEPFPVLIEKGNGLVAQAEKEMVVEKDSCTLITE